MHTTAVTSTEVSHVGAGREASANNPSIKLASGPAIHGTGRTAVVHWSEVPQGSPLVIFIRHGQTPDNVAKGETYILNGQAHVSEDKVLSGHNSVGLSDLGRDQARQAGRDTIKAFGFERMARARYVNSPQQRVKETHQGYKEGAGLEGIRLNKSDDPRLMERSAGKLTGLTREKAAEQWPEMSTGSVFKKATAAYPGGVAPDGNTYPGESMRILGDRACPAVDEHIAEGHETLVLTAHEMTIKTAVEHLETGCVSDHKTESCTTDETFKVTVPNATPLPYANIGGRWVRVDIKSAKPAEQPAAKVTERTDADRLAA